jgi:hypothetical protein
MNFLKLTILTLALGVTAFSQDLFTGVSWDVGFPVGTTHDFLEKTSYAGFSFEGKRFLDDDASVGMTIGWNHFSELTNKTIVLDQGAAVGGAVSGTQVRYANVIPILINADYFLGSKNSDTRLFIGANIGTYHIWQELDIGIYAFTDNLWHFGLAPEAGLWMQLDRNLYFLATFRYNYAFASGDPVAGEAKNTFQYMGINLTLGGIERAF